jgi:transcriptional regulator GlxA family with amidase domain
MSELAEEIRAAIPGLTNLETGYSLPYAVDYYERHHRFHVVAKLSQLLAENDQMRRSLAREQARKRHWKSEAERLTTVLDWIEAEPEDPIKVQLWARSAIGTKP